MIPLTFSGFITFEQKFYQLRYLFLVILDFSGKLMIKNQSTDAGNIGITDSQQRHRDICQASGLE